MKTTLPQQFDKLGAPPKHASYLAHRKQVVWQVILPVVVAALALGGLIALICLATFQQGQADVARWAAISTIWIVLPVMVVALIVLAILLGLIYLMIRLLQFIPTYTGIAQDYAYRAQAIFKRITGAAVKPIFFLDELGAYFKALFGRK